jgi:hypothetical protein
VVAGDGERGDGDSGGAAARRARGWGGCDVAPGAALVVELGGSAGTGSGCVLDAPDRGSGFAAVTPGAGAVAVAVGAVDQFESAPVAGAQ